MYIVNKVKADNDGRIVITGLFGYGKVPKKVVLVVDGEKGQIIVMTPEEAPDFGIVSNVENKNRVVLPRWMLEETATRDFLLIIDDDGKKYISPKNGNVLP